MSDDRICDLHRVERPRERLLSRGAQALSDEELLAAVLRTGYAGRGVLELARDLVRSHPGGELGRMPTAELSRIKGMGPSRACALAAAIELGRRWDGRNSSQGTALDSPRRVFTEFGDLREKKKEHFVAFYVDALSCLIHKETVSIGTLTASLVHPREVFSPAVERGAAGVIVAHNHPSGNLEPSLDDKETTRRLAQAGKLLGIPLLDHVLVTARGFYSFREHGLL